MNLRHEFMKILDKYGSPVLIVRQDKKLRCSCWDEKTQESDRECPICFGLGWNPIVEKHLTRTEDLTIPETLARVAVTGSFGQISVPSRAYYVSRDARVREKDLIVDVDWTPSGKPIYNGGGIYEISHIDDTLRLNKGEQIYKLLQCKDTPIEKNIRGIRVVQVKGIVNYELMMGDV